MARRGTGECGCWARQCAAGAAVLVIAGPLVNRYLRRLMLSQARQQMSDAPRAGGSTP